MAVRLSHLNSGQTQVNFMLVLSAVCEGMSGRAFITSQFRSDTG